MNFSTCSLILLMSSSVLHCETDDSCAARKRMQVVCFFALWYRDFNAVRAKNIDPYLCNQMVFAHALCGLETSTNTWTIRHIANDPGGLLLRSIVERNRPTNIPSLISVGGNNDFTYPDATIGKGKYRSIATNPSSQRSFLQKVTEFLREYNLDGVDFFWNWIGRNSEKYADLKDLSSITAALCSNMKRNGFLCSVTLRLFLWEDGFTDEQMQVYCFYGLWYDEVNMVRAGNIDPYLCSQMVFAYVYCDLETSTNTWTIVHIGSDPGGYLLRSVIQRTRLVNVPNLVSIGGYDDFTHGIGKVKYRRIATDPFLQQSFVEKVTEFLQEYDLDGVDFFWNWIGRNSNKYADLKDLSSISTALCSYMKRNGFICSITIRLLVWEDGFTEEHMYELIRQIVRSADIVHIWTADIAVPSLIPDDMLLSVNASSHFYYKYSVNYMVDYFKTALNDDKLYEKLSLVIPLQWNSKGISAGKEPVFGQAPLRSHPINDPIRSQYPYYRICERVRRQIRGEELNVTTLNNEFPTAYSLKFGRSDEGLAVPYLTENVAKQKVRFAQTEKLGAVSVFQIGADDVHGWCNNQSYPILTTIRNAVDDCELYKETS